MLTDAPPAFPPWTPDQAADLNDKVTTMGNQVLAQLTVVHDELKTQEAKHTSLRAEMEQAVRELREKLRVVGDESGQASLEARATKDVLEPDLNATKTRLVSAEQLITNMQASGNMLIGRVDKLAAAVGGWGGGTGGQGQGGGMNLKEFVDIKQLRPDRLKSPDEFRPWRENFENYCELVEQGVKEILKKISNGRGRMTETDFRDACGVKSFEEMNRRLSNALLAYTEGEAKRIVKTAGVGNGMQAYQELCRYYDLKTDANENKMLSDLLGMASKPAKNLKEVRQLMVDMEARRAKIEELGGEVPKTKSLRAILIGLLDEETRRHIGEAIAAMDYHDAKKRVSDYVTVNLGVGNKKDDDMDIGRCAPEKTVREEEKEEGSNDGGEKEYTGEEWETYLCALKGKGKGGAICFKCGKTGHFARECWSNKGEGKGKGGKGQPQQEEPKGKGKGKGPKGGCYICSGPHYQSDCPKGGGKGKGRPLYPLQTDPWTESGGDPWGRPTQLCCLKSGCSEGKSAFMRLAEIVEKEEKEEKELMEKYAEILDDVEEENKLMEDDAKAMTVKNEGSDGADQQQHPWQRHRRKLKGRWRRTADQVDGETKKVGVLRIEQKTNIDAVRKAGGWKKVRFTVDSGAGETVMNKDELPGIPVSPSPGSQRGQHYVTAAEERIANEGEKNFVGRLSAWNSDSRGGWKRSDNVGKGVNVQIADVSHPLMAVKKLCTEHRVVFDDEGSYAQNKRTGEIIEIKEDQGEYIMEMWVLDEAAQGFTRQGQ